MKCIGSQHKICEIGKNRRILVKYLWVKVKASSKVLLLTLFRIVQAKREDQPGTYNTKDLTQRQIPCNPIQVPYQTF
uniref:Uncharacterized protein n=1 Tax=Rhizophora mucronata TaxID=61149 RepID=A0A2P2PYV6_RHIMU